MATLRFLIVDDEAAIGMVLKRMLERRGHVVITAADADSARAQSMQSYNAAAIDRQLPGNGEKLAEELNARADLRGRVVLMTGGEVGKSSLPVVKKPFDYDELVERLEALATRDAPL
jgi:two-component system, cell cycle response regulator CpdR